MTKSKRRLIYLSVALVLGVAVALGVLLTMGDDPAPMAQGSKITTSAASANAATSEVDPLAIDPAKQEPMLDKFKSKDPFVPLGVANSSSTSTSTTSQTTLTAKVTMNSASYTVVKGDKLPPTDAVFSIADMTSSSVTFALISGTFENGDSSITVNVGESVKVVKEGGTSYTLKVVSVGSSGDSGSATDSGHSISVLSISESNGTPVVTLEVDDETYADKKVGDTFATGWGEIKIIAINVGAQTVTIMHGDQTITLNAGQVVVK